MTLIYLVFGIIFVKTETNQYFVLGGKDLVSKSQILAYYELVLKYFLATKFVS